MSCPSSRLPWKQTRQGVPRLTDHPVDRQVSRSPPLGACQSATPTLPGPLNFPKYREVSLPVLRQCHPACRPLLWAGNHSLTLHLSVRHPSTPDRGPPILSSRNLVTLHQLVSNPSAAYVLKLYLRNQLKTVKLWMRHLKCSLCL